MNNNFDLEQAIKAAFMKHSTVDKKRTDEEHNSVLKQILDNAVIVDGVIT